MGSPGKGTAGTQGRSWLRLQCQTSLGRGQVRGLYSGRQEPAYLATAALAWPWLAQARLTCGCSCCSAMLDSSLRVGYHARSPSARRRPRLWRQHPPACPAPARAPASCRRSAVASGSSQTAADRSCAGSWSGPGQCRRVAPAAAPASAALEPALVEELAAPQLAALQAGPPAAT